MEKGGQAIPTDRRPRGPEPPKQSKYRVNEMIKIPQVRLVDAQGTMVGVVPTFEAMARAREAALDLVEVAPTADPPVCKILDFGKFQYELQKKEQASKRKVHRVQIKEMRVSAKIGAHDLEIKVNHVRQFLLDGDRVTMKLQFKGRDRAHPEEARGVMDRTKEMLKDVAKVEQEPRMMFQGKKATMTMVMVPLRAVPVKAAPAAPAPAKAPAAAAPAKAPPAAAAPAKAQPAPAVVGAPVKQG